MRSIVFAILVYFVCASITCNKTEENDSETTVTNTLTVPSTPTQFTLHQAAVLKLPATKFIS